MPLFDPPRHDSAETIRRALNLGVNVKMITGSSSICCIMSFCFVHYIQSVLGHILYIENLECSCLLNHSVSKFLWMRRNLNAPFAFPLCSIISLSVSSAL